MTPENFKSMPQTSLEILFYIWLIYEKYKNRLDGVTIFIPTDYKE